MSIPISKETTTSNKMLDVLLRKGAIAIISTIGVIGLAALEKKFSIPTEKDKLAGLARDSLHSVISDVDNMLTGLWKE